MDIEIISIDEIKPYEKNAKKHPKKQVDLIANSIETFGMNDPIAVWGKQNIIVEGHGRLEACKKLGYKKIPCIRLDNLTDEERKAYTLAHNKVAESEWDKDLLMDEIIDLDDFDFEDFGFEFEDEKQQAKNTQERLENILNIGKANYPGVGKYDIPQLYPIYEKEIGKVEEWIGFNYVLTDKNPENKGVHFFIDDYQFERVWNSPEKYIEKLQRYKAVLTPDFSPYCDMPLATQIYNHYRKHWVGRYLQEKGVNIIPTIRASTDERSYEYYLEGEPVGGVVCISSMWANNDRMIESYNREFYQMVEKLKPQKIYVYGKAVKGIEHENIEFIKTFAEKRWSKD